MRPHTTVLPFRVSTGLVWLAALALAFTLLLAFMVVNVRAQDSVSPAAPTGFGPQAGSLAIGKRLVTPSDRNVLVFGEIATFQIVVTNTGTTSIMYLPQEDQFDDRCLDFLTKANPPENDNSPNNITWSNLVLPLGHYLAPGESYTTTVNFDVTGSADVTDSYNTALVSGAVDADNQPVSSVSTTIDFPCYRPARIGDRVWEDLDGDGVQDAGEPGVAGVVVRLTRPYGPVITATTSITGFYSFTMLPPGNYTVNVDAATVPSGMVLTTANLPHEITLAAGENYDTADFGYQFQADLAVTKSDNPDPVIAGRTLTYTLVITNNGPAVAYDVSLTDTLPAGITFASASPAQDSGPNPLVWNVGTLAVGATRTYTVVATVDSSTTGPTISNTAVVGSSVVDPVPANNSDTEPTTINTSADLAITKSDNPDPVVAGRTLTYTLSVVNNGPSDAVSVVVTDSLPAGVTWVSTTPSVGSCSGTTNISCNLGTMVRNATATITVVVTVDSATTGTLVNTTGVTSSTPDPDSSNNFDSEPTTINTSADLEITKSDSPDPVSVNNPVAYTLIFTNHGPSDALNVVVTDTLPAGVTFVSATPGYSGPNPLVWSVGTLVVGASRTYTVVVTVDNGTAGPLSNTATIGSSTSDPEPANNSDTEPTTVLHPGLTIAKTPDMQVIYKGTTATFTITVSNTSSDADLSDVTVTDALAPNCDRSLGTLVAGATTSYTCTVTANNDFTNTADVIGTPPGGAAISASDTARVLLYVAIGDRTCAGTGTANLCDSDDLGVKVPLTITGLDVNGGTVDISLTTSVTGFYKIDNLVPGVYTVTAQSSYGGYLLGSQNSVLTTSLLTGGSADLDLDFRYVLPAATDVLGLAAVAEPASGGVRLHWSLRPGATPEGFVIYRTERSEGPYKRITAEPILATPGTLEYDYLDQLGVSASRVYWYRLQALPSGGMIGPIASKPAFSHRVFVPTVSR